MRFFLVLLPLLSALALAEDCQCPQVKCPSDNAMTLCQCINGRESKCVQRCPDYIPTYRPCPIYSQPVPIPTAAPPPANCTCDRVLCPMIWPLSCQCANDGAKACYKKCGGALPALESCDRPTFKSTRSAPSLTTCTFVDPPPTLITLTLPYPVPATTETPLPIPSTTTPLPVPTHAICGGGRGNNVQCEEGYVCIKDPFKPGCGPACDGLGICVEDRLCGGFAGFPCRVKGQVCVEDPRDDCDPEYGGADCGGLCVWEST